MRHLCESGLRENCTSRLSGGRRPAPTGASSDPTPAPVDLGAGPGAEEGGSHQGRASLARRVTLPSAAPETVERSTPDWNRLCASPAHLARLARRGRSMNSINFKAGFAGIKWDKWDSKGRTAPVLDNAGDDAAGLSRTQEGSCAGDRVCTPVSRAPARSRAPFHCAHPGQLAIALRGLALHGAMMARPTRAGHRTMVWAVERIVRSTSSLWASGGHVNNRTLSRSLGDGTRKA